MSCKNSPSRQSSEEIYGVALWVIFIMAGLIFGLFIAAVYFHSFDTDISNGYIAILSDLSLIIGGGFTTIIGYYFGGKQVETQTRLILEATQKSKKSGDPEFSPEGNYGNPL